MAKYATNASGAMAESISGSVVPLAMFILTIVNLVSSFHSFQCLPKGDEDILEMRDLSGGERPKHKRIRKLM